MNDKEINTAVGCVMSSSLSNPTKQDVIRVLRGVGAEIERLQEEVKRYKKFKDYFDSLYGQGLEVANWHLNGSLEPFDNFFDYAVDEMEREQ